MGSQAENAYRGTSECWGVVQIVQTVSKRSCTNSLHLKKNGNVQNILKTLKNNYRVVRKNIGCPKYFQRFVLKKEKYIFFGWVNFLKKKKIVKFF